MKGLYFYLLIILCVNSGVSQTQRQDTKQGLDLFLLIGQSNMAGRGKLDSLPVKSDSIWVLNKNNEWVIATEPLHFDKPVAGAGLAFSFASDLLKTSPRKIGLIPCAVGGSSIDAWMPGATDKATGTMPYDDAVKRAVLALKSGQLKGILWHQGESDSNERAAALYEEKFYALLRHLSRDLDVNLDKIPVITGELGTFYTSQEKNKEGLRINEIFHRIASKKTNVYCVSSSGLTDKGDATHFDTASLRELGKRYALGYRIVAERLKK
ncbi:sialate O-acetylesterase [Emticicia sp. CRIBPO]|uniref:sialate O-acetylesterase n=1 Tax=Emticicia sp. CRIBPO TaxID=2683258 RepID=UPI00141347FB|nr:sialate O-acetylesterase [Emticicia sp. CRIBPO]NBA85631.1 sialate O-acetylesterase [Emticicia sp. CRIBPO]